MSADLYQEAIEHTALVLGIDIIELAIPTIFDIVEEALHAPPPATTTFTCLSRHVGALAPHTYMTVPACRVLWNIALTCLSRRVRRYGT